MRVSRMAASAALSLALSGCGLSSAGLVVSAVAEGTSVAATGKGVTDYALSAVTDRDCVLLYGLTRGEVCTDPETAERESASAMAPLPGPPAAKAVAPQTPPDAPAPVSPLPTIAYDATWTFVLGLVEDYAQAVSLARRLQPKPGLITAVEVRGKVMYRVTTEPFGLEQAGARRRQITAQNFADATLAAVCPGWMQDGECVVLDRVLPL